MRTRPIITIAAGLVFIGGASAADIDRDGLEDDIESQLLAKYRPYYRFHRDENFRPIDAASYLVNAEVIPSGDEDDAALVSVMQLRGNTNAVLEATRQGDQYCTSWQGVSHCSGDITNNARLTNFHINPLEHPPGVAIGNPGRLGAQWAVVEQQKNVGLYGHVVPLRLKSTATGCGARWNTLERPADGELYYKVEYWQLFGYSSADSPLDIGDHEGDWASVQLLIRPARTLAVNFGPTCVVGSPCTHTIRVPEKIISVMHFAHGREFRFDLGNLKPAAIFSNGMVAEFRGSNFGAAVEIDSGQGQCDAVLAQAQNNTLRLFKDPQTGEFTHPVVFIERGAHEFWPTEQGSYWATVAGIRWYAPSHEGSGRAFLTNPPHNLGEVENPISSAPPYLAVLRFNGYWGAYSRKNDPPPGPALHAQWNWPQSSSVGWQLPKDLPY